MTDQPEEQQTSAKPAGKISKDGLACFNSLVKSVDLLNVHLVSTEAMLSTDRLNENKSETELFVHIATPEFRAQIVEPTDANQPRVLYCGVRFVVSEDEQQEFVADSPESIPLVRVTAEYSLFYKMPGDLSYNEEGITLFAGRNAVFNAWPFFRELAHSLVGRMGMPAVMIPLFRLPASPH